MSHREPQVPYEQVAPMEQDVAQSPPVQLPTQLEFLQVVLQPPEAQDVSQCALLEQVRSHPCAQSKLQVEPTQPIPPTHGLSTHSSAHVEFDVQATGQLALLVSQR